MAHVGARGSGPMAAFDVLSKGFWRRLAWEKQDPVATYKRPDAR